MEPEPPEGTFNPKVVGSIPTGPTAGPDTREHSRGLAFLVVYHPMVLSSVATNSSGRSG